MKNKDLKESDSILKHLEDKVIYLYNIIKERTNYLTILEKNQLNLKERLNRIEKTRIMPWGREKRRTSEIDILEDTIDLLELEIDSLKDEIDSLEDEIDSLEDEIDSLEEEIDSLEENINAKHPRNSNESFESQNNVKTLDPLFEDIARFIVSYGTASVSIITQTYSIPSFRAFKILTQFESHGIVSILKEGKPCTILVDKITLEYILNDIKKTSQSKT